MRRCSSRWPLWSAAALGCYLGLLLADRSRVVIRGRSMAPALLPGDLVLTIPLPRALRSRRSPGQVVLVEDPEERGHLVVKRVHEVRATELWLEGDDPAHSTDSRIWGWVPAAQVRGLVVRRWPQVRTPLRRMPPRSVGTQGS